MTPNMILTALLGLAIAVLIFGAIADRWRPRSASSEGDVTLQEPLCDGGVFAITISIHLPPIRRRRQGTSADPPLVGNSVCGLFPSPE